MGVPMSLRRSVLTRSDTMPSAAPRMSAWSQSICALKILRCTSTPSVSKRRSSLARYTGRQSSVGTTATLRASESMRCNSSCRSLSMRFFASYELPQETTVKTANM